jgi:hypothetical protein
MRRQPSRHEAVGDLIFSTQQLRQLGDIRRDPPRLILAEQFGCRAVAIGEREHVAMVFGESDRLMTVADPGHKGEGCTRFGSLTVRFADRASASIL